eukprot:gnl/TRDRNA2_/TRDRNA2_189386_c0_seq1.p1 gnl/TRDRNA2_/TRDRNA2_189386_c0~~gnl/TRDRNA2_/TRDRNA2_189386_c0_seq1.p1  ORF type:complete len:187 (+),score=35.06 gnl/TRDRNA2_/TRDRNA2_189386_c0_seq1:55-615(+)
MSMMRGIVKSYNCHKGWGFVTSEGTDYFLLRKELKGYFVDKGDEIWFTSFTDEKGRLEATNIQVTPAVDPSSQIFLGSTKSFGEGNRNGLISCEATEAIYGKDVFLMQKDWPNGMCPGKNSYCKFQVEESEQGPVAKRVEWIGQAADRVWNTMQMWEGMMTWSMKGMGKGKGKNKVMQPMFQKRWW